ncbi:divalent metal cation transporter [Romeria aff. gracilis LEGE 07310]|uniref:Divalent metal cation transporter n=1 Tax=Vasconcelosia minhoensis LEGE 07310 TaxID=915328 RepID=A0A8J7AMV8_9CYAN|nr:divalent metal cation transporter [Romeria gracilis]MBE9077409.1 divalent metal cation transporter [Romeria aff. gracilis LEGE 07310]
MSSAVEALRKRSLTQLGPGLLMAGAAIGVSHLVQSTRAGALYGWGALVFVLLANLLKYPFYEYGHRYAAATGNNLVQAYRQMGRRYLVPFLLLNSVTAVGSFAVDAFIAAMLVQYLWLPQVSATLLSGLVLLVCWGLIAVGRYRWFERITKSCVILLSVATVAAVVMAVVAQPAFEIASATPKPSPFSWSALPFIVAFMGWMPGGLELSVWQSLWVQSDAEDSGQPWTAESASFDFNVGYSLTVILACLFLALGTMTLQGRLLADTPAEFAGQLIGMYTTSIGEWAAPVVGVCAIAAIFSTTFTVVDAFPRTLAAGLGELYSPLQKQPQLKNGLTLLISSLAMLLLVAFSAGFNLLIDTITIIAFVAAPYYAWLNIRCIQTLPDEQQPRPWLVRWATLGFLYLLGFSLVFLGVEFIQL